MSHIDPAVGTPPLKKRRRKSRRLESWPKKAKRHNVCTRTLDRWAAAGVIAPPFKINGRKYADANEEPRHDAV
jgi:hypothetical protein